MNVSRNEFFKDVMIVFENYYLIDQNRNLLDIHEVPEDKICNLVINVGERAYLPIRETLWRIYITTGKSIPRWFYDKYDIKKNMIWCHRNYGLNSLLCENQKFTVEQATDLLESLVE